MRTGSRVRQQAAFEIIEDELFIGIGSIRVEGRNLDVCLAKSRDLIVHES